MKNFKNRRFFLKALGLSGLGLFNSIDYRVFGGDQDKKYHKALSPGPQTFNMCGYRAPKMDKIRVGFIGLGNRGLSHVLRFGKIKDVEIVALCDLREDRILKSKEVMTSSKDPESFYGSTFAWKKMCDRNDIDLIVIATNWDTHAAMCQYAMQQGKHVCVEVPAALTVEDCWRLVETSEKTKKHCMMLENCCYDHFELLTLNMARQGYFGEIVHGEGAYNHNLLDGNFDKNKYWNMWRLKSNAQMNGNLYPTHGLGPICQIMNINRGDKMDFMVSLSSNDFSMNKKAAELAAEDNFYAPYTNLRFRGNVNTSIIKTNRGKSIMVQHDVSSPNVYSRIHRVVGNRATALKYPLPGKISNPEGSWIDNEEMEKLERKYEPEISKKIGEVAKKVKGHGGMDFLMTWRLIDCLRNGLPLDMDVYDAALLSVILPLSQQSIMNKSNSVKVPDFTRGSWKMNEPVDIFLKEGGNTKVQA